LTTSSQHRDHASSPSTQIPSTTSARAAQRSHASAAPRLPPDNQGAFTGRIRQPSFYSWRRVLRERGLIDDGAQVTPAATTPAFVKVTVTADPPVAPAIELVLGKGRLLRVRPGFDADLLRQLVRVLEEPSC
jgi:hypothetical protein